MRVGFLKLVRERAGADPRASADGGGAPVPTAAQSTLREALEGSSGLDLEAYFRQMATYGNGRESWGGFVELDILCHFWGVRGWVFARRPPESACELVWTTTTAPTAGGNIAILWSGTHWDALRLDESLWVTLRANRDRGRPGAGA